MASPRRTQESVVRLFWSRVVQGEGCWLWTGATRPGKWGYGAMKLPDGAQTRAHRFSWELHNGPIPAGLFVCHHCDNPICVRPDHLFLGTNSDNMRDASRKKRFPNNTKTHCKNGHPFDGENTRILPSGSRACRACQLTNQRRHHGRPEHGPIYRKLRPEQVAEMRDLHAAGGIGYGRLAKRYGIARATVAGIIKRDFWKVA